MALQEMNDELRKTLDDTTNTKVLHSHFHDTKGIELKTNIPKEDLHCIVALEALTEIDRYSKQCGLKNFIQFTKNLIRFYKVDKFSEEGSGNSSFVTVAVAERQKAQNSTSTLDRWMGKE